MRILILIIAVLLGMPKYTIAQKAEFIWESSATRSTKDLYEYVQQKIKSNQYYLNEFKINPSNIPWMNTKSYQNTQQYYYSFVGDATPILRFVSSYTKIAGKNYYSEYLYDIDGNLAFYFEKQNDRQKYPYEEFGAFFDNNKCVNIIINQELIDETQIPNYTNKLENILGTASIHSSRFIKDMQEVKD